MKLPSALNIKVKQAFKNKLVLEMRIELDVTLKADLHSIINKQISGIPYAPYTDLWQCHASYNV